MKKWISTYWKTLVFFGVVGLVGGFFTGIYLMDSYPAEVVRQMTEQGITKTMLGALTAVQSLGYGVILGAAGIFLGRKTGLWKDETSFEKKPLLAALAVGVIGGVGIILPDLLFFGKYSAAVMDSYAAKPTAVYILAAVVYGGVIEEVMLRLFFMSLVAFILHVLFGRKREKPTAGLLMLANLVAALLFAAAHLPATAMLLGLSPMIVFRCFLLNGGFGLLFGLLYRKYGLRYAMLAHGGCHVVSKLIWLLFV